MDRLQHTLPGTQTFCQLQTELYQLNLCEESLQLRHIAQSSIFSLVLTPLDQKVIPCQHSLTNKQRKKKKKGRSCQAIINPQSPVLEQPADCAGLRPNQSHVRPWLLWQTTKDMVGCLASHHFKPQARLAFSNFRFNANFTKQYYFFVLIN